MIKSNIYSIFPLKFKGVYLQQQIVWKSVLPQFVKGGTLKC